MQYNMPPSKKPSINTNRRAFSAGTERSKVQSEFDNTVKCKRALDYNSNRTTDVTLLDYAECGLTTDIQVPYTMDAQTMAKEGIKLVLLNAYELILDLHRHEKSLKGLFSSRNFLVSLQSKKVRLQDIEVQPYCSGDAGIDKSHFIIMIKDLFGNEVPTEILVWLDCMANGAPDNVLRHHINILHAHNILGEFNSMYHSLLEMKALDKKAYNTLLSSLIGYKDWKKRRFIWSVLEDNYQQNGADSCDSNVFGLMKFIRNCFEHPAKLYKEFLMAILLVEYRDLLSDVQIALYKAQYLPQLDIKSLD